MTINKSVQRECRWCYGKGQIEVGVYDNTGNEIPRIRVCPRCEGKGYVIDYHKVYILLTLIHIHERI